MIGNHIPTGPNGCRPAESPASGVTLPIGPLKQQSGGVLNPTLAEKLVYGISDLSDDWE